VVGTAEKEVRRDPMLEAFRAGDPHWDGIILLPRESADLVLGVIDRATPEESGRFVSHHGDKRWL
jgi:hypothetical protein